MILYDDTDSIDVVAVWDGHCQHQMFEMCHSVIAAMIDTMVM